jgi:transposase
MPDEQTRILRRRISRRAQLVRQRTREKNQVHAILIRNLKQHSPAADLLGAAGRRWLATQELPFDEREMVEACLRGIDFLDREVAAIDRALAELVLASPELRRLMTLPGVSFVTDRAASGQLPRPRPEGASVGLGTGPAWADLEARPGRGAPCARRGGLARGAHQRAVARLPRTGRLAAWPQHRHRRRRAQAGRDRLAHAQPRRGLRLRRPSLTREKIRKLELATGAKRRKGKRNPVRVFATREQHQLGKELAAQAELAYRRLMADWQPSRKQGAGAAPGRASCGPSSGQAARQGTAPPPAL